MGPKGIQFVLTLLVCSRSMECKREPDYTSITAPFTGTDDNLPQNDIEKIVKDFDLSLELPMWDHKNFYWTNKAGPLSSRAIHTSLNHLKTLTGPMIQYMFILCPSYMRFLTQLRLKVLKHIPENASKYGNINRRLSIVNDPEGKARVIAIFDYLTQALLEPLSKQMFSILRNKFPQDRTFTQNPILPKNIGENHYWSIDLSSATDRFPVVLQQRIFEAMTLSKPAAWAWKQAMICEPFLTHDNKLIRYAVGQPMGARTS